ncbi:MAG: PLP-dependent aminotransferase family protein [Cyanobacteria bacterium SZAS LIN-3]|nr:PLP-dependent aminotransferase family protein [Cyanobacteria bacterium SZAS LIN-3]
MNWLVVFSNLQDGQSGSPIYTRIVEAVRAAIESGLLAAGDKLPTNRELSTFLKVDRSTVARAYLELSRLGLIDSQVGRGTFVSVAGARSGSTWEYSRNNFDAAAGGNKQNAPAGSGPASGSVDWNSRYSRYVDGLTGLINRLPQYGDGDYISFAGGIPAQDFYPSEEFKKIVRSVLDSDRGDRMFDYSPFNGEPELRQSVIDHLDRKGMAVRPDELLILSGSQQGIDLVANMLVDPGDCVIVEEPTYFWAISNFKARQARLIGCSHDEEGISLSEVESALRRHAPKFLYVMPNNQNPTGRTMTLARRKALVELCARYNTPILEDDYSGDLSYDGEPLPTLHSLSPKKDLVIYQGTFSKALCPGVRLGWLVGPVAVMEKLSFAKRTSDLATNSMAQVILNEFLTRGLYQEHLARVNAVYGRRRDAMVASLEQEFKNFPGVTFIKPSGGLFLWLTLPVGLSNRDLLNFARHERVVFSPGDLCFTEATGLNHLRLCFIQNDEDTTRSGISRLARAYKKYLDYVNASSAGLAGESPRASNHVLI